MKSATSRIPAIRRGRTNDGPPHRLSPAASRVLRRSIVAVLAVLGMLTSACEFRQRESVRAASFLPHAGRRIEHTDVETYLRSRVAMLVSSEQNLAIRWARGDARLPEGGNFGCAAAIDRRGYFLTASHCLKHPYIYLIFHDSRHTMALPARVVWRGNRRHGQQDLALLHVPQTLSHHFTWAERIRSERPAMAVGLSWTSREIRGLAFLGGKTLSSRDFATGKGGMTITNDLPLQSGDSGGPLLDPEGCLLGINTQATPPLLHMMLPGRMLPMLAERPNMKTLATTIEMDATNQTRRHPPHQPIISSSISFLYLSTALQNAIPTSGVACAH